MTTARPGIDPLLQRVLRHERLWLTFFALVLASQISPLWSPTPDACTYLSIARSVAHGEGLRRFGSTHLVCFPGYPLLISPLFLLSDRPFLLLSCYQWGMAILFMIGVYLWAKQLVPQAAAVLVTGISTMNSAVWPNVRPTLSEITFMTMVIWGIYLLNTSWPPQSRHKAVLRTVFGSAFLAYATVVRPAGLMFVAGACLVMLVMAFKGRMHWSGALARSVVVATPALLLMALCLGHERQTAQLAGGTTYLQAFTSPSQSLPAQAFEAVRMRISDIGRVTLPGFARAHGRRDQWVDINMFVYLPFSIVVAIGWWKLVRSHMDVFAFSLPFYIGLHLAYSVFEDGARFFSPLIPVFVVSLWMFIEPLQARRLLLLTVMLAIHLPVAVGHWLTHAMPEARQTAAWWPAAEQCGRLISQQPGPVAVDARLRQLNFLLQFTLDQPVAQLDSPSAETQGFHWLIESPIQPIPPGYVVRQRYARYCILEQSEAPASEPKP